MTGHEGQFASRICLYHKNARRGPTFVNRLSGPNRIPLAIESDLICHRCRPTKTAHRWEHCPRRKYDAALLQGFDQPILWTRRLPHSPGNNGDPVAELASTGQDSKRGSQCGLRTLSSNTCALDRPFYSTLTPLTRDTRRLPLNQLSA
jgi:hypothetical protein